MNKYKIFEDVPKLSDKGKNTKDKLTSVAFTGVEHNYVKKFCKMQDITISCFIRAVVIDFLEKDIKKGNSLWAGYLL